jgi:DNA-binding MarR family transcriptional regulator
MDQRDGMSAWACAERLLEVTHLSVRLIKRRALERLRGLTVVQFRSLTFAHRRGGCTVSELAGHLGIARPTASALADRLVRRGLMTRRADPGDRRQVTLALTTLGSRRVDAARREIRRVLAAVLAPLPRSSLAAIGTGLEQLAGKLAEEARPVGRFRRALPARARARPRPEGR